MTSKKGQKKGSDSTSAQSWQALDPQVRADAAKLGTLTPQRQREVVDILLTRIEQNERLANP